MMKRCLILFALLISFLLPGQDVFFSIAAAEKQAAAHRVSVPAVQAVSNSNFIFQRCEWNVDPAVRYISGRITTHFIPSGPNSFIEFDLDDTLFTDSALYHGMPLTSISQVNDILHIDFPFTLPSGVPDSITLYYHGVPPTTGFGSFALSSHNSVPLLWTLSEPYGARDWWPCKQNLDDKIDSVDIIVTTPSAYRTASNGLLKKDTVIGASRICTWQHRYPIAAYLVCMAVSNYSVFTQQVPLGIDTVVIENYVYPEDSSQIVPQVAGVIQQMQLYDSLFGHYPFALEKYGHTQCNFGGGMEHQTMTFVGGFNYELLAHELAHHWFGDKVTCGSWEDIWLNEGFATYLSGLCYERYANAQYWIPFLASRISYATSSTDGSVWCNDTTNVSRIFDSRLSYAKGGMVLHSLRWVVGDSAFFSGVRNYLSDSQHAYGFARTSDLRQHIEQSSGQNLGWFFSDWFTGEGYPSYQITWSQDQNNLVSVNIQQATSHPSVSFFEMPLPLQFKNGAQDTIVRIQHNFSGESFTIQLPFAADSLIFDPQKWIISASNTVLNVAEPALNSTIMLFPNPSNDYFFIVAGNAYFGSATAKVYDIAGRMVSREQMFINTSFMMHRFDITALRAGTYFLELETENGVWKKRFVKN